MAGWKTWLAAIGTICSGISLMIVGLLAESLDPEKVYEGFLLIMAGLAMIGIGHKIEKTGK